ncbi:MAG: hypothetical protein N7Q72_05855 [Spiroplasma sp. Tabriz.8]|nr:hypothetical protein [Spiroplasma sp. Tabriz.8]
MISWHNSKWYIPSYDVSLFSYIYIYIYIHTHMPRLWLIYTY